MSEPEISDPPKQLDSAKSTQKSRSMSQSRVLDQSRLILVDTQGGDSSNSLTQKRSNFKVSTPKQVQKVPSDPATEMIEELSSLIVNFQTVMRQARNFFGKYLPREENNFLSMSSQLQHPSSYNGQKIEIQRPEPVYPSASGYDGGYGWQQGQGSSFDTGPGYQLQKSTVGESKGRNFSTKKKQKNMDPNKPKSPLTPYFLFFSQTREILRQKYPEKSLAEIGALGGTVWRQLSQSERQEYKNRYEVAKRRYNEEIRNYNSSDGVITGLREYDSTNGSIYD